MTETGIDWNEVWKERMLRNIESRDGLDCTQYWPSRDDALKYEAIVKKDDWKRGREKLADIGLKPDMRVLDIGAGPGSLAIPLARQVKHVTAVEPSETMRWCLENNLREAGLDNVAIVPKRWEDINVSRELEPPYDLVIASYSLGMLDLREAILKMDGVSSGRVYLFWFAESSGKNHALWEKVHGRRYRPKPQADVVFNLLYRLGFIVNFRQQESNIHRYYVDLEEAYRDLRGDYRLSDERKCADFKAGLQDLLQRDESGLFMESENKWATIWWEAVKAPSMGPEWPGDQC